MMAQSGTGSVHFAEVLSIQWSNQWSNVGEQQRTTKHGQERDLACFREEGRERTRVYTAKFCMRNPRSDPRKSIVPK